MPSKILYIEDSAEYAELAIKVLNISCPACEVKLTDSLQEVERLLKAEPFDLVLSDFSLIGFDARDVLKTCAALAPGTPLILLTGVLSDEVGEADKAGPEVGLATVYGSAKQHNGWVSVDSELGKGSEFSVFLPFSPCAAPGPGPI